MEYTRCLLPEGADILLGQVRAIQAARAAASPSEEAPLPPEPAGPLFDQPVSVAAVELPLRDDAVPGLLERAAAFYRLLKTHLFGRFLGMRRASPRTG